MAAEEVAEAPAEAAESAGAVNELLADMDAAPAVDDAAPAADDDAADLFNDDADDAAPAADDAAPAADDDAAPAPAADDAAPAEEKAEPSVEDDIDDLFGFQTWTDSTGKYSIEARFIEKTSSGIVRLEKTDGTMMRIPFDRLSNNNQMVIMQNLSAVAAQ